MISFEQLRQANVQKSIAMMRKTGYSNNLRAYAPADAIRCISTFAKGWDFKVVNWKNENEVRNIEMSKNENGKCVSMKIECFGGVVAPLQMVDLRDTFIATHKDVA